MACPVRIANFSGAMGDRFSAFEEAVQGDPVDVVIGDSMAEITMSMVVAGFHGNPEGRRRFFSEFFLRQLTPQLEAIAEKGIKVVTNAGIYHPAGLAEAIRAEVTAKGLGLKVAYVTGDDLTDTAKDLVADGQLNHLETRAPLEIDEVLAVNAYLGGWGIKTALDEGADIVITGRVADASLVTGPAAWWHGWDRGELDKIAGATAAAHIIECGPQATGGNFAGFTGIADNTLPGFPIAEVAEDGSFVITKRTGDGGAVTVDTVTAQLMYEIQGPRYLNPDVTWHTDSIALAQDGPDRVRVTGARGSAASETTKVGVNFQRGYRGATWLFPTGLDVERQDRRPQGPGRAGAAGPPGRRAALLRLRATGPRPGGPVAGHRRRPGRRGRAGPEDRFRVPEPVLLLRPGQHPRLLHRHDPDVLDGRPAADRLLARAGPPGRPAPPGPPARRPGAGHRSPTGHRRSSPASPKPRRASRHRSVPPRPSRSDRSSTRAPATRAPTPTWACGPATKPRGRGSPGSSPPSASASC